MCPKTWADHSPQVKAHIHIHSSSEDPPLLGHEEIPAIRYTERPWIDAHVTLTVCCGLASFNLSTIIISIWQKPKLRHRMVRGLSKATQWASGTPEDSDSGNYHVIQADDNLTYQQVFNWWLFWKLYESYTTSSSAEPANRNCFFNIEYMPYFPR